MKTIIALLIVGTAIAARVYRRKVGREVREFIEDAWNKEFDDRQ